MTIDFKNPSLSNLCDQSTDGTRAHMSVVLVEFSPRSRREKSVRYADPHHRIGERAQRVEEVVRCIPMLRVDLQRAQEARNGLLKLTLAGCRLG